MNLAMLEGFGALKGLRVVDLSRALAGPYCTQLFGDHGAEVIKVEPPTGDETRTWGPPFQEDTGVAAYFQGVNRNKLGVTLDLGKEAEREKLRGLLDDADVLIENFKPGTLEKWGLGYEALKERFPRLIHCRISGFGADGPLGGMPGYDAAVQAMSGIMSVNGELGGEPLRVGIPLVDIVTGMNACIGILMALREREVSGLGQFVEAALFDCALAIQHPYGVNYLYSGKVPGRGGNAHPNITPYDQFRTKTGNIFLAVGNDSQFAAMCRLVGAPELAADERFATNGLRNANRPALRAALETIFADRDGIELTDMLIHNGVPCGPVLNVEQALNHPQAEARGMRLNIGGYKGIASPIKLSRTPASYRRTPPGLNEHEDIVFGKD